MVQQQLRKKIFRKKSEVDRSLHFHVDWECSPTVHEVGTLPAARDADILVHTLLRQEYGSMVASSEIMLPMAVRPAPVDLEDEKDPGNECLPVLVTTELNQSGYYSQYRVNFEGRVLSNCAEGIVLHDYNNFVVDQARDHPEILLPSNAHFFRYIVHELPGIMGEIRAAITEITT